MALGLKRRTGAETLERSLVANNTPVHERPLTLPVFLGQSRERHN